MQILQARNLYKGFFIKIFLTIFFRKSKLIHNVLILHKVLQRIVQDILDNYSNSILNV